MQFAACLATPAPRTHPVVDISRPQRCSPTEMLSRKVFRIVFSPLHEPRNVEPTHLSLTDEPALKGVPKGWTLPIRDVLIYSGAKFLCPCAGAISLMPGTSSNPAFRRVDVDVSTGKVTGLF